MSTPKFLRPSGGNTGLAQLLLTPIPGTVPGAADFVGGSDNVQASNIALTSMKRNYYAGYAQDDIKVTQKLTVNLGLRYEYFGQLLENYGAQSNFVPSPTAGAGGISTFYLTNKRCNTPFSADFTAALATDNIAASVLGPAGTGRVAKDKLRTARRLRLSDDTEVGGARRLRNLLRRL